MSRPRQPHPGRHDQHLGPAAPQHRVRALGLAALCCGAAACSRASSPPLPQPFDLVVQVDGDPGRPVAGARLSFEGREVGKSDARGRIGLRVHGLEGQRLALSLVCPTGYVAPAAPLAVTLRRLTSATRLPRLQARCVPALRRVVIAVRASGGADLPVRYLGEALARTDRCGAAHALLRVAAGERLQLQLDTSAQPDLRPHSPTAVFEVPDHDAVFLFTETFVRPRSARPRTVRPPGPTRI